MARIHLTQLPEEQCLARKCTSRWGEDSPGFS
jgi:hypothetical protein